MLEVIVRSKDPSAIMEIVRELRSAGLVQGQDFDFAYKPAVYDNNFSSEEIRAKHTVFTFYTDKYASWFLLKYGS